MNPTTTLYVTFAILALVMAAAGFWWYRKNRPQHSFIGIDFGAGSVQPKRIRHLYGPFRVKRSDGTKVQFPVPQGYTSPRQDQKGTIFFGDLETGQLLRPHREGNLFEAVSGIFLEKAFADGRVQQIVASTKAGGIKLEHLAMGIGVIILLLVVVVYQYANAGGI